MLGEPRRELVELVDRERPPLAGLVADRGDLEQQRVDPVAAGPGVTEHRLERLELVLRRPRMGGGAARDQVLDVGAPEDRELRAGEPRVGLPDLRASAR